MQAASKSTTLTQTHEEPGYGPRLLAGMASALAEKRYADLTIADVVRHAHVSKRTFYEHFPDKEACFLAAYQALSSELMTLIAEAAAQAPAGEAQLEAATRAYFNALAQRMPLVRAFLSEVHAAGPAAIAMRRNIHQRFAQLLQALVARARKAHPELQPLSHDMATALVGAINELVLLHAEEGQAERVAGLTRTATELLRRVLLGVAEKGRSEKPTKKRG